MLTDKQCIDELRETVIACKGQFDLYVGMHLKKTPPDYEKARINQIMSKICSTTLKLTKGEE